MDELIHISIAPAYRYKGWYFEMYRTRPHPPHPLNIDGYPRKRAGRKFWKMITEFNQLSIENQEEFRA